MWNASDSTSSGRYYAQPKGYTRKKLKSLGILSDQYDFKEDDGEWETEHQEWFINEEMVEYFGDGEYHSFKLCNDSDNPNYTHIFDGYYYHKDWFIDNKIEKPAPVIQLDEEDFIV